MDPSQSLSSRSQASLTGSTAPSQGPHRPSWSHVWRPREHSPSSVVPQGRVEPGSQGHSAAQGAKAAQPRGSRVGSAPHTMGPGAGGSVPPPKRYAKVPMGSEMSSSPESLESAASRQESWGAPRKRAPRVAMPSEMSTAESAFQYPRRTRGSHWPWRNVENASRAAAGSAGRRAGLARLFFMFDPG